MDDAGRVLWERKSNDEVAIASATKMVTALVVRAEASLDEEVVVGPEAAATSGGKLSLEAGERFSVEELLWGMLLNSSNDAAVALAEHVAGSEAAFVAEMNEVAAAIGARRSHFTTAHGLDQPGHYSTARDLVKIARRLLDDALLQRMVASPHHTITGSQRTVELENTNVLLEGYQGMIGIKTGFTSDAGNVLVAAAERFGRRIYTVALGSVDHFADSRALLDYGFAVLRRTVVVPRGRVIGTLFVDGAGGTTVVTGRAFRGPERPQEVSLRYRPARELRLPVGPGDLVGDAVLDSGGEQVGKVPAYASGTVDPPSETPWIGALLGNLLRTFRMVLPGEPT